MPLGLKHMLANKKLASLRQEKRVPQGQSEAGFSVLEMALMVVVGGMVLAFIGSYLMTYLEKNRVKTTEIRLNEIQESLMWYLNVNGHYPCPASRDIGPLSGSGGGSDFGRPVASDCTGGAIAGTSRSAGVRIGAVPTRVLNLSDEYFADGWGNQFTYAVTQVLATPTQYMADGGRVVINNVSGPIDVDAHFVLLSHGNTGTGAYSLGGGSVTPCGGATLDAENCNNNRTFISAMIDTDPDNAGEFFDDHIHYPGQSVMSAYPSGSVVAFSDYIQDCPYGWKYFERLRGRFPIGASPTPIIEAMDREEKKSGNLTLDLSPGEKFNGNVEANVPSYIPLIYCEKLPELVIRSNVKLQ